MSVNNPWLNPYQRSHQQIKDKLITEIKKLKNKTGQPLITDYSEGNILTLIVSLFAAVAEVLHFYIDNMARETFLSTTRKYSSLVKHGELVGYYSTGAVAATVDVTISRPINSPNLYSAGGVNGYVLIPKSTQFIDNGGQTWESSKDVAWYNGVSAVAVPLIQHKRYTNGSLINSIISSEILNSPHIIEVPHSTSNNTFYEQGTMTLQIDNEDWVLVDTFAFSNSTDKHFRVELSESGTIFIVFGDGTKGMLPSVGKAITDCTYYVTTGYQGNIQQGSITTVPSIITSVISDAACTNLYSAGGGATYETFDMLKEHIPLYVRTLGVAITKQDFIDLALQVPGVRKCAADYECGRKLNLYIAPVEGIVAAQSLKDQVLTHLKSRAPLTTWLTIESVGENDIMLEVTVKGRKGFSKDEIYNQILQALKDTYSISNTSIGDNVRLSDIYALLDNLSSVDFLHINTFFIKPWPTTIYANTSLQIEYFNITSLDKGLIYYIQFSSSTNFIVRAKSGGFSQSGIVGIASLYDDTVNGNKFTMTISDNGYLAGYNYSIQLSEPNKDFINPGFNLPVFLSDNQIKLNIEEVL